MNFVKAAKFDRKNISRRKKNTHPNLDEQLVKKISVRSAKTVWEKKGENLFLLLKTWFWKKNKII